MNTDLARNQMLTQQIRAWDVSDPGVLDTLGSVPREAFVPPRFSNLAFADTAVPIGHGQQMLAPKIEGRLLQALGAQADDSVLEIGTGTGFMACCFSRLAARVTSLDIHDDLIEIARRNLASQDVDSVELATVNAFEYRPDTSFEVIAVTGSTPEPVALFESWLTPGGRLFAVTGELPVMTAWLVTRLQSGEFVRQPLFETVIPPLVNAPSGESFQF